MTFNTPYVCVDLDQMEKNIRNMIAGLKSAGIDHRPHIKAHKSVEIAKKQLELGAVGITVAKLAEAEVMVRGGIKDILIAFPILGDEKLRRLKDLLPYAVIRTIVDSRAVAEGLSRIGESAGKPIEVLIELDGGIHRGGVQPGGPALEFARSIVDLPGIRIVGLMAYVGQIYGEKTEAGLKAVAGQEAEMLFSTQRLLCQAGFDITILSGGSTASSVYAEALAGLTESRAGNYVFYDMNAIYLGIATVSDAALKVCSTVVSIPLPGFATIDAGSKALTSDGSLSGAGYGQIIGMPDVQIVKLNEEHGYLQFDPAKRTLHIGDIIEVIPNHCCVVPNLCDCIYGFRNGAFEKEIRVDARGKNY